MLKNRLAIVAAIIIIITMTSSCGRHRVRSTSTVERTARSSYNINKGRKTTVKMKFANGIYYVPCVINGTNMDFIFDTGASDVVMSLTEALFLYKQGKLSEEDIMGNVAFQIADGSIGEGTIINLKTVTIGDKTLHNVKATVISNMDAPLLLGQSALSRFGKLSIDYSRKEITFE